MSQRKEAVHPRASIRVRLMLILCFISAVPLLLVGIFLLQFLQPLYDHYIQLQLEEKLNRVVQMVNENEEDICLTHGPTPEIDECFTAAMNQALNSQSLDLNNCCMEITDQTMHKVYGVEHLAPCLLHRAEHRLALPKFKDTEELTRIRLALFRQGSVIRVLSQPNGTRQMVMGRLARGGQYGVLISTNLAQVAVAGTVIRRYLPTVFLISAAVSLLGAWMFSTWFTRPLNQLSSAARRMARGDYDVQVPACHDDEIGMLTRDFNHMAGEIKRTSQLQRELLANASHDLRTPLTLIKGYAETLRDLTGDDPVKRTDQLNVIVDETDRLTALVNSMMELSKVSSGTDQPNRVHFDMAALCDEVSERYQAVCDQNGYTLTVETPLPCPVYADPAMMERVLHNLLGNALHHLGEDGVFILRAIPGPKGVRIEVEDHGPGIAEEELPHLFDRYYRSRKDSGKPGTGLGLTITKAILQSHGFRFGVQSKLGVGSTFWFVMTNHLPQEHSS